MLRKPRVHETPALQLLREEQRTSHLTSPSEYRLPNDFTDVPNLVLGGTWASSESPGMLKLIKLVKIFQNGIIYR